MIVMMMMMMIVMDASTGCGEEAAGSLACSLSDGEGYIQLVYFSINPLLA